MIVRCCSLRLLNRFAESRQKYVANLVLQGFSTAGTYKTDMVGRKRSPIYAKPNLNEGDLMNVLRDAHKTKDYFRFGRIISDVKRLKDHKSELSKMLSPAWISSNQGIEIVNIIRHLGSAGFDCNIPADKVICLNLARQMVKLPSIPIKKLVPALMGLHACKFKAKFLGKKDFDTILNGLSDVNNTTDLHQIVSLIRELGNIEISWSSIPSSIQEQLLALLLEISEDLKDVEKAQVVFALGRMRFDFHSSPLGQEVVLKLAGAALTCDTSKLSDNFVIGSTSAGLSMMNLTYADLSPSVQRALLQSLDVCLVYGTDEVATYNLMKAVSELSVKWSTLSEKIQRLYQIAAIQQLRSGELRYAGIVLNNFCRMGATYKALNKDMQEYLQNYLTETFPDLQLKSQGHYLQTLGRLECPCSSLSSAALKAVEESVEKLLGDSSMLFLLLEGLTGMGMKYDNMTPDRRKKLEKAIQDHTKEWGNNALVIHLIETLDKFGARWTDFSPFLRKSIAGMLVDIMDTTQRSGTPRVIPVLHCLVEGGMTAMELPWAFSTKLDKSLDNYLEVMKPVEVVKVLTVMSQLGVSLKVVSEGVRLKLWDTLLKHASELTADQALSVCDALGSLKDSEKMLNAAVGQALVANVLKDVSQMTGQQILRALKALRLFRVNWSQLEGPVRERVISTIRMSLVFMSEEEATSLMTELSNLGA